MLCCFCCAFSVLHRGLESVGSVGNAQKRGLRLEVPCQLLVKMSPRSNKNSLFTVRGTCPRATGYRLLGASGNVTEQSEQLVKTRRGKPKHSSQLNASLVLWGSLLMLGQKW